MLVDTHSACGGLMQTCLQLVDNNGGCLYNSCDKIMVHINNFFDFKGCSIFSGLVFIFLCLVHLFYFGFQKVMDTLSKS